MKTLEQAIWISAMRQAASICEAVALNYENCPEVAAKSSVRLEFKNRQIGALKCQQALWTAITSKIDAIGPGVTAVASKQGLPPIYYQYP